MEQIIVDGSEWSEVVASSATVDTLLSVEAGAGRLWVGDTTSAPLGLGIAVAPGYQIVVPAGVSVSAVASGSLTMSVIVAPFGA